MPQYEDQFMDSTPQDEYEEDLTIHTSYRIGFPTFFLMVFCALFFDLAQIVITILSLGTIGAVISPVLSGIAWILFYMWFKIKGVDIIDARRWGKTVAKGFVELVPYLDLLPMWTITVFTTTQESRKEDKIRLDESIV
jgi:hypothetical protein